jgi:hypothetical protein
MIKFYIMMKQYGFFEKSGKTRYPGADMTQMHGQDGTGDGGSASEVDVFMRNRCLYA